MSNNCSNCGAPLQGWKCPYCETEYPERKPIEINYHVTPARTRTVAAQARIPLAAAQHMTAEDLGKIAKRDLVQRMTNEMLRYFRFETWVDPETMSQVLGAHVELVAPERNEILEWR